MRSEKRLWMLSLISIYIHMDEIFTHKTYFLLPVLQKSLCLVWNSNWFNNHKLINSFTSPGENSMIEELNMIIIHFPECRDQCNSSWLALLSLQTLLTRIKITNCCPWLLHHVYGFGLCFVTAMTRGFPALCVMHLCIVPYCFLLPCECNKLKFFTVHYW